jgi:hypothetical protein
MIIKFRISTTGFIYIMVEFPAELIGGDGAGLMKSVIKG